MSDIKKIKAWYDVHPQVESIGKGMYELQKNWFYNVILYSKTHGNEALKIHIPRGYVYDGASIPVPARLVVGNPGDHKNVGPALPHDEGYLTHRFERWIIDEIFRQLLIQEGKPLWAANLMWAAVRSPAGAIAWRNDAVDLLNLTQYDLLIRSNEQQELFDSAIVKMAINDCKA